MAEDRITATIGEWVMSEPVDPGANWAFSLYNEEYDVTLDVNPYANGEMSIQIEYPWSCVTSSYDLTPADAKALGEFLLRWAASHD